MDNETKTYMIKRHFQDARVGSRIMERGLTLDEAKAHCADPGTLGWETVNVGGEAIRTQFFDGFTQE